MSGRVLQFFHIRQSGALRISQARFPRFMPEGQHAAHRHVDAAAAVRPLELLTVCQQIKKILTLRNNSGTTERVEKASAGSIGAAFIKVDDKTKQKYGISYGVEVGGVSDGKFREAGIKKGFIILTINNYRVSSPNEAEKIIKSVIESDSDKVLFIKGIQPNGEIKYVAVDLR